MLSTFQTFSHFSSHKSWGDSSPPKSPSMEALDEKEALAKLSALAVVEDVKKIDTGDLHPQDAGSVLQLVKGDRLMSASSWEEIGLRKELQTALSAMRFNRPSKIQAAALPIILGSGGVPKQSFIGQAQSGSGKTAAFVLGFLQQITEDEYPQAIVVAPTLELAEQIHKDVVKMGKELPFIKSLLAVKDLKTPKSRCKQQVIVGTPGKLFDLVTKARVVDLSKIKVFVLDEADTVMTSMRDQTMTLRKRCPANAQSLFFSATFPDTVAKFAESVVNEPYTSVRLKPEDVTVEEIYQFYIKCSSDDNKLQVRDMLYNVLTIGQSIIFMQHVKSAQWLAAKREELGHTVSLLHGRDMEAKQRLKTMQDFRDGNSNVLITTNVLARGIDVLSVTMVINYDLPLTRDGEADVETYIHRIGRTGRMGNKGISVSFIHDEPTLQVWNNICKDPSMEKAIVTELKNDETAMYETLEKLQQKLQDENKRKV